MTLEIRLSVDKPDLLCQEGRDCGLTFRNLGRETIPVVPPPQSMSQPTLRVVDVKTAAETIFRERGSAVFRERPVRLGPGRSLETGFDLRRAAPELPPGEYDLSVLHEETGSESAPVRLRVSPSLPTALTLDGVQSRVAYGFWVNPGSDGSHLVRTRFDFLRGGGIAEVRTIGATAARIRPIPSLFPNRIPGESHWIAWMEGGVFKAVHFSPLSGPGPIDSFPMPDPTAEIIASLHSDPEPESGARPLGAALVWAEGKLRSLALAPGRVTGGPTWELPGPRPRWMRNHEDSTGRRTVLFARCSNGRTSLYSVPWPNSDDPTTRLLGEWAGEWVAAGSTMDFDDRVHGGVLLWNAPEERWQCVPWTLSAAGEFTSRAPLAVASAEDGDFDRAHVRVSATGALFVLLRGKGAAWRMWEGRLRALPEPIAHAGGAVDLGFSGGSEPVFILGRAGTGFHLLHPDGTPFPHEM